MFRGRSTRAFTLLVLILAQAAFGRPHDLMGAAVQAHAQASGGMAHEDCHNGTARSTGDSSGSKAPVTQCGSCPASMPGQQGGGCLDMASCGPSSASRSAPVVMLFSAVSVREFPSAICSPAAPDFVPDPPPPRA